MKRACAILTCIVLAGTIVAAQKSELNRNASATISGVVSKDPTGEPVKKALIELIAENQSEGGNYTATTGMDGHFHIEGILPGRYRLFAERTGFLEVDKHHRRTEGRLLTLSAAQELKEIFIHLQAAAVLTGRVTDEDGDPLPDAQVAVHRQTYVSGRSHWEQVGGERTSDLGEYRIAGLPAGSYFVSVTPPPSFKNLIEERSDTRNQPASGANEKPTVSYAYMTTYYPGTKDRSQATAIQLRIGDDFPLDLSLTPGPSVSIRGSVANVPQGASAMVTLQSCDFGLTFNGAEVRKDGSFEIRDVSPGMYSVVATLGDTPVPMMARQSLQVGGSNVEGLRLVPQVGGWVRGRLRLESQRAMGSLPTAHMYLSLLSADGDEAMVSFGEGFSNPARVNADRSFEWKNVPAGQYHVQFSAEDGMSSDWFLKSASAGGRDVTDTGFSVNGGAIVLDLVANADGAVIDGAVVDADQKPVAGAVVVAVPELRLRARNERFRKAASDQRGRFTLHGVPPGTYTLFAWESVDGEAYYDAEFLKGYESQGSVLRVSEGEHKSVQLVVIPVPEEAP